MTYSTDFERRRSEPGVYFIQSRARRAFKIGGIKQNKVKFRLGRIAEAHELVFFHPCDFDAVHRTEWAIHAAAEAQGFTRLKGEWFKGEIDAEAAAMIASEA